MERINAVGLNCPMPVIMAKKQIDEKGQDFLILVDNEIAVENLKKLASSQKYYVDVNTKENCYEVYFSKSEEIVFETEDNQKKSSWVVFMGKDTVGDGEQPLGTTLAQMFFYTLSESNDLPEAVLFMNRGVMLPTLDAQIPEHLEKLQDQGVKILVCGTCLDYYHLKDQLKIGTVSNMYEIVSCMQQADKVITL